MKNFIKKISKTQLIWMVIFLNVFLFMSKCSHDRKQKFNQLKIHQMEHTLDSINIIFKDSIKTLNYKLIQAEEDRKTLFHQLEQCHETQHKILENTNNTKELKNSIDKLKKEINK